MRRRLDAAGYAEVKTPQLMDARQWEQSGHWGKYRENMFVVPDEIPIGRGRRPDPVGHQRPDGAQADELPGARPDLPPGHQIVSRPADPHGRVRLLPPQRAARRAPRHHARSPVHPGRRAYLRARRPADRGGAELLRPARQRLPRSRLRQLCDQAGAAPRQALRQRGDVGLGRAVAARRGRGDGPRHRGIWLGGAARRRRVLRAQARIPPDRRDRADLAGRHDPDRHGAARAARRELCRRGRRAPPPDHAPPRDPRHVRALHRHPDRAPRRPLPALARAGAGGGGDDRLRRRRLCRGGRRRAREGRAARRDRPQQREDQLQGPRAFGWPRSRTCWWSASARPRKVPSRCGRSAATASG